MRDWRKKMETRRRRYEKDEKNGTCELDLDVRWMRSAVKKVIMITT